MFRKAGSFAQASSRETPKPTSSSTPGMQQGMGRACEKELSVAGSASGFCDTSEWRNSWDKWLLILSVRGGGWPAAPFQIPADGGWNRLPSRQGQQGLSHLLFFQLALHVFLLACPCHKGPCWPSRALRTHWLCCPTGMHKVSQAGHWPALAAWASCSKSLWLREEGLQWKKEKLTFRRGRGLI